MSDGGLAAILEAALFVSAEPLCPGDAAKALGLDSAEVEETLEDLVNAYGRRQGSGLQIVRIAGGYAMATRQEMAEPVARLLAPPGAKSRLSRPALETLAIVAYQQPVTQAEVEAVRGVSVDGVLKGLVDRRLVREEGRKAVPGRPILYGTTAEFLHYFGLNTLEDLPPLEDMDSFEEAEENAAAHEALEAVGLED